MNDCLCDLVNGQETGENSSLLALFWDGVARGQFPCHMKPSSILLAIWDLQESEGWDGWVALFLLLFKQEAIGLPFGPWRS